MGPSSRNRLQPVSKQTLSKTAQTSGNYYEQVGMTIAR
jgi:hypothetical protein